MEKMKTRKLDDGSSKHPFLAKSTLMETEHPRYAVSTQDQKSNIGSRKAQEAALLRLQYPAHGRNASVG
jgi:hypothetical protein